MRETPQLKHIEQVSDGWIKKYILTYVLPDGSDYIYEAASRKGLEAYRAELARLEARSNTAIAAIDEGAETSAPQPLPQLKRRPAPAASAQPTPYPSCPSRATATWCSSASSAIR